MPTIASIETIPCRLPPRREIITGARRATGEERMLVRILTDTGVEGWGEATAIAIWGGVQGRYFGETPQTVAHVVHDVFGAALLGANPLHPAPLMDRLDDLIRGHPYAKAAVEMALQDIRGKVLGQPAYSLLGGPYRSAVQIAHMISYMSDDEALKEAGEAVGRDGITAFQVKGGADPVRDVRLIARLRKELPAETALRLDANRGYGSEPKRVANIACRLEGAGLDALEQPGQSAAVLAACRQASRVSIIADESCWTAYDVLELVEAKAADAISVYVAKAGGMARAIEVAQTGALFGLRCDMNGSLESGIGTAASVHVAMAIKNATVPSVISIPSLAEHPFTGVAGRYWRDDVVAQGFTYKNGYLALGERPGLGIEVDIQRVERMAGSNRRITTQ
jgi:L-alanine-DL-glutamate epimerase-like enolase superfamily enzyme